MSEYTTFRQRLDTVLRTLDVKQVQEFLIAENQWSVGQPADPEFAMWMMVAGTPTLQDLHERARQWLVSHGHAEDAKAFLTRDKKPVAKQGKGKPSGSSTKRSASKQPVGQKQQRRQG